MKRLILVVFALAALFCLWWFVAAGFMTQAYATWFDRQRERGWLAEYSDLETTGFPLRHVTRIAAPALADPRTGAAWQATSLAIDSPAIWPGDLRLRFPETAQSLAWLDRRVTLTARDMVARLTLAAGPALRLRDLGMTAGAWSLRDGAGMEQLQAAGLTLSMTETETEARYRLTLGAPDFSPGDGLRRLARAAPGLPRSFDRLEITADVTFDRPWDIRAIEERRPQPRVLHLRRGDVWWGDLRLSAAGRLDIDETGTPTGAIELRAENWRDMLRMANQSGLLGASATDAAERALSFLASLGGQPEILEAQINFRGGVVALGPIPLGPAPRLILR